MHDKTPVRIGLDGFNMAMPRGTGVATYGRVLSQALGGLGYPVDVLYGLRIAGGKSPLLREVTFFDRLDQEAGSGAPGDKRTTPWFLPRWAYEAVRLPFGLNAAPVTLSGQVIEQQFGSRMPRYDRLLNVAGLFDTADRYFRRTGRFLRVRMPGTPDIMHWTYPLPIVMEGAYNVYTMHDLVPLRLPYATLDNKRLYLRLIRGCLRWGDHVCTVSEASKRDIVSMFGAPPDRVTNTYQSAAMPAPAVPDNDLPAWLSGLFGLEHGKYFLFYGALEPKKNIGRIIEAFLASGSRSTLVIVGGRAWKSEKELRLIQKAGETITMPGQRVRVLEYMPGTWLTTLIRGARAVLFPSLYEGFGLPVLEAMQQGTPVLTSTESSLPEVAGTAALLVDPYDVAALSAAIIRLDGDEALREALSAAGPGQAEMFSMEAYRSRIDAMYRKVLETKRGTPVHLGLPS